MLCGAVVGCGGWGVSLAVMSADRLILLLVMGVAVASVGFYGIRNPPALPNGARGCLTATALS